MRRSRDVWIGAALLAVAAAGIGLLVQSPRTAGPPYRLDGHGTLGLSGLGAGLRAAGFGVDERLSPTIPDHGLIVSVEPRSFSHDEAAAWVRSIRAGAVLLLATDHRDPLTEALGLGFGPPAEVRPNATGRRAFPGLSADGVTVAATFGRLPRGSVALVGSRDAAAVALVPVGRGSVFAVSQPRLLTNAGIAGDGLAIALPLAAGRRGWARRHRRVPPGRLADARLAGLPAPVGAARDHRGRGDRDPGRPGRGPPPRSRGPRRGHDDPNDRRARPVAGRDAPLGRAPGRRDRTARARLPGPSGRPDRTGRGRARPARVRRVRRGSPCEHVPASRKSRGG